MGITRHTALIIQANDVTCDAGGPSKDGKYAGFILFTSKNYRPLISTELVYDNSEQAIMAMQKIVGQIKAMNLLD